MSSYQHQKQLYKQLLFKLKFKYCKCHVLEAQLLFKVLYLFESGITKLVFTNQCVLHSKEPNLICLVLSHVHVYKNV